LSRGGGFIGSAVVRHLLRDTTPRGQHRQTHLCGKPRLLPGATENLNYAFEKHCICEGQACAGCSRNTGRPVMNLAAESHVDRSIDGPGEFIQTNIVGTFTLLQEALRYWRTLSPEKRAQFRFLHISTMRCSARSARKSFHGDHAYAPNSPYSARQSVSDAFVRDWGTYECRAITNARTITALSLPEK